MKFFNIFFKKSQKNKDNYSINISKDINKNINKLKNDFGHCTDLVVNYLINHKNLICLIVYIKSLVDDSTINSLSLEQAKLKWEYVNTAPGPNFNELMGYFSGLRDTKEGSDYEALCAELLSGNTIFLIDGCNKYFSIDTDTDEGRSIDEPTSQTVIRGPKDAFTERIEKNTMLIRKRIKNRALRVENYSLGSITNTTVNLMYIDKVAQEEIVQEIRNRLGRIEIDGILEGSYIEELIKDNRYSIFPTFLSSENPDSVAAALLEGKVAILVEGTPYVLTAPALMVEFLQAREDYYHHFIISSMMRILRFIVFFITLLVPAIYISVTTFHQEIIPTPLLISIVAQREGVPFPALAEALLMEFTFEILRETGVRMPRAIGPAISIVGALVLGQAAVEAGIVSAAMVIVVSITAISSFAIPNYELSNAIRSIRFALMLLAGAFGLYGVIMGLIVLVLHLCSIKSITCPYLMPIAPKIAGENKDTFFRFPLWKMKYRPAGISGTDAARIDEGSAVSKKQRGKQEIR
ncbi:spore germination protein [Candidatus Contubernalis alkaliaceticus]|uniref:spore germination protein n=1 Tax=Candidatus Contubernalis alkaliaceticus TaxID=338645 RepID=UPI001F4BD457|nr:spore germination protein [Candidatus Contubernalis alkalaceticus]UNC91989.1 spore germination protein [Candidatus Contubernalis alkalaceticus]